VTDVPVPRIISTQFTFNTCECHNPGLVRSC